MKKLYFSTFVEGLEKPIEAMLHKEGGVAVEHVLNGAALYRSVREPALPYMHQTFQVLFQMKPMANVNDAVRRLLATGGWLDRFPYEETQGKKFRIVTAQDIQQRAAMVLQDVRYVIECHFDMTDKASPSDNPGKFQDMLRRRAQKGACYHTPYFGCREFPASFREWRGGEIPAIDVTQELGWMLYDMDYSNPQDIRAKFFRARLEHGVLDCRNAEVVT